MRDYQQEAAQRLADAALDAMEGIPFRIWRTEEIAARLNAADILIEAGYAQLRAGNVGVPTASGIWRHHTEYLHTEYLHTEYLHTEGSIGTAAEIWAKKRFDFLHEVDNLAERESLLAK